MSRRYSLTPEDRALNMARAGGAVSGNSYIAVVLRETGQQGRVPYYKDPDQCDHGVGMCPTWSCVESWTMDYRVLLPRTGAGRKLAETLNVDPLKVALIEHGDLSVLDVEAFRPEVPSNA